MNVFAYPKLQAIALIEMLGWPRAMAHAIWAYENVSKPQAEVFWAAVIKEIRKRMP